MTENKAKPDPGERAEAKKEDRQPRRKRRRPAAKYAAASNTVKLTVRLPAPLHQALKERAAEYDVSLNRALVDTLTTELTPRPRGETEVEKIDRLLREKGRLADTSWMNEFIEGIEIPSLEEVREWLRGVPLTDWVIEDRGPR